MKVGDIIEQENGPFRVASTSAFPPGKYRTDIGFICGFTSYEPVEGPPTKKQHEYREEERQAKECREAAAAALRERIKNRCLTELPMKYQIPREIPELVDLIVDLIHEESEY